MNNTFGEFGKRKTVEGTMSHLMAAQLGPAYMRNPFVMTHLTAYSQLTPAEETGLKQPTPRDTLTP